MLMSWELASFLILAAVLIAGFAWYERSRPPSQVVALVAALAALAIAGRIAFAAFPNVKPTTDVVVFAGFSLGGAAGFAVGALTALVSNLWFGQGPWTPWQMAAWGMCGLLGAAVGLRRRPPGRLALALLCGFAGLAYGALMNFSLMATYGGDLSLRHFLLLESRAIPFEVAHAGGNFVLALVAGPAMIRMLTRFRTRFDWHRATVPAATLLALAVAVSAPATAHAGAARAVGWLITQENSDGGYGSSPGSDSSPTTTAWVMLGLEAAGTNPLDVSNRGNTPVDFLRSKAGGLSSSGDFSRTILALEGAGIDPRSFGGRDLVAALLKHRRGDGSYEGWPASTAFAVIALRSAGATGSLAQSQSWLGNVQNDDGGWGDVPGAPSNADVTGAAMEAMPFSQAADRALGYLRKHQRGGGGFATGGSGAVNTQSTAWAVQGMIAAGADPSSIQQGGKSGLDYIAGLQQSDGHYRYSASSDQTPIFVTAQAMVAAARESFPVAEAPRAPAPSPAPTRAPSAAPAPLPSAPAQVPGAAAAPPATPGAPLPQSSAGPGGNGGAVPAVPSLPESSAAPPTSTLPLAPPGGEEAAPLSQGSQTSSVEADDGPSSPWIPIGIGVAVGVVALVAPVLLGKRYAW
jgi:energy-coupling factor transport system substrate-specific component